VKNKIGLLFGSFNPVHNGHLIIANYILQYEDLDEILLVVSPQNPFKTEEQMLDESNRYRMVELALNGNEKIKPCDIELKMGTPSYTINTLEKLIKENANNEYILIIGSDNQDDLDKWKDYEKIFSLVDIFVYPRYGYKPKKFNNHNRIKQVSAPLIEMSSSFIRNSVKQGKDIRYFVPDAVFEEISRNNYYK